MSNPTVQLFPYLFEPHSGSLIAAEWGQPTVPENRLATDSRFLSIPFVRFRCTADSPGSPIIFL